MTIDQLLFLKHASEELQQMDNKEDITDKLDKIKSEYTSLFEG